MKIFYTASYYGKKTYQKYYDLVLHALGNSGVDVISPEKGNYLDVLNTGMKKKIHDEGILHHEAVRKGILMSDAVVIEASHEDFQLGTEAAFAVENKKHVLCLSVHENFSKKMKWRNFKGCQYNKKNIDIIIYDFVEMVKKNYYSERFNCFLSPSQLSYIKRKSKANAMNASEYVRKLIDEDQVAV